MKKSTMFLKASMLSLMMAFAMSSNSQNVCDTIQASSIASGCTPQLLQSQPDGYYTGTNMYVDLEKAQRFIGAGGNNKMVTSVLVLAYKFSGNTNPTFVKIYSIDSITKSPDILLATSNPIDLNNINSGGLTQYTFTSPVIVPSDFYVSLVLPTGFTDTMAVASTANGCFSNDSLAWEMWYDSSWHSFALAWGTPFDIDLFIFPVTCNPVAVYYFSGNVFNDINNDNIKNNNEQGLPNILIKTKRNNYVFNTDIIGNYSAYSQYSLDTLTIVNPMYSLVNPLYNPVIAGDTGKNFAVHYLLNVRDLRVTVTNLTLARPGFDDVIRIIYKNVGNNTMNGNVTLDFDNNLTFLSSNPVQTSINGNTIIWNYTNLAPTEQRSMNVTFNVPPSVQLNTVLNFTGIIYPIVGDTAPNDNHNSIEQIVTGSYDPNEKEVIPDAGFTPQQLTTGEKLVYTIHFQNTGTDTAFNIKLMDTLSANLDATTFEILSSSHLCTFTMRGAGIVEFNFPNILLPDSNVNLIGSNGFVKYAVKPKSSLLLGDSVTNMAYIYFDFNAPVATNTTSTLIHVPVGIANEMIEENGIYIYPNPASTVLSIKCKVKSTEYKVQSTKNGGQYKVYDEVGQMLINGTFDREEFQINISNLAKGLYFLKIEDDKNIVVRKFVKE